MIDPKQISKILAGVSDNPGIYKMSDEEGRVIYVGKAKNLQKRLKQYFQKDYQHSTRTKKLMEKATKIETISVDSELEATILENNVIKQLQPKYNVIMKDDKSFVYIKITREDFPRIQIVRQTEVKKDGAKYIGPKTAKHKVRETFLVLKKIFPFRHCNLDISLLEEDSNNEKHEVKVTNKVIKYPCLDYYIKRCVAPCIGKVGIAEYKEIIKNVEDFLEGKADKILKDLTDRMMLFAGKKEFEKAGKMRDKIDKVKSILEKQKVATAGKENRDVINYCIVQGRAYFNLFQIRDGQLIGQENFILSAEELEEGENLEVLEAFLLQYYEIATDIPEEILIPHELQNNKETEAFIETQAGKRTKLLVPKIGTNNKLLEMSLKNAKIYADRNKPSWKTESELTIKAAEELQKILQIEKPLKRIECYDISHLSGTDTVGSMVVFQNGVPKNDLYRQFKVRTVSGPDDYRSLEEVLTRRFLKIADKLNRKKYKLRKAAKKDEELLKNNLKNAPEKFNNFYLLEDSGVVIAFAQLENYSEKIGYISHIWVDSKNEDKKLVYRLLKELVQKSKAKRTYSDANKDLLEAHLESGFEEIKKTPEELPQNLKHPLAFDKLKLKEDKSFSQIPDLVIIDGGKGQLTAGTKVFEHLKIPIPYIALAKRLEEVFSPPTAPTYNDGNAILLPENNEARKLLERARDEAHRFALTFNRKLRSKRLVS